MSGIVALDAGTDTTGALVYWRLDGGLDPAELAVVWRAAGLDEAWLPATPAPSTALARALRERSSKRRMVRPLNERGAHAIVNESASTSEMDGEGLTYAVDLKVRLDAAGRAVITPADHPLAPQIRADYNRCLDICSADDIGCWLVSMMRKVDGVSLRDRGGFYYIPPAKVALWRTIVGAMRLISGHRTFEIPAIATGQAVEAILDAIEQEATTEAVKMEEEITSGSLGERALKSRVSRCSAVETKVAAYEALLGAKLESLRERLERLRGNLVAAALVADDEG